MARTRPCLPPRSHSLRRGQSFYYLLAAIRHESQENRWVGECLSPKRLLDFALSHSEPRSQAIAAPGSSNQSGFVRVRQFRRRARKDRKQLQIPPRKAEYGPTRRTQDA